MSETIRAPFTAAQVDALNTFQTSGVMHPFTCGAEHSDARFSPDLVATEAGWVCPVDGCDYTQDWAHEFMTDEALIRRQIAAMANLFGPT